MWQVERGDEVAQDIIDGNRLSWYANPARRDHHRQTFHQRADQLERKAARTQDDRGTKFNYGDAAGSQNVAHLVPAAQVRRQRLLLVAQTAQVDNSLNSCCASSLTEVLRT